MCISASVGRNGSNSHGDVKTVQIVINMNIDKLTPMSLLEEDGVIGDKTVEAIETFQQTVMELDQPDGMVDPGGETLTKLREGIPKFCQSVLKGIYLDSSESLIEKYCSALSKKMRAYDINTPLRLSHFLAQVGHESGELRYCEELASGAAYEGRRDLGNTQPGDGSRFKGRGLIQLTGRTNYASYSKARGIDYTTDEGARLPSTDPDTAVDVACWFWSTHNLNELADNDDLQTITKRINGGLNGIEDRSAKLVRAKFFNT